MANSSSEYDKHAEVLDGKSVGVESYRVGARYCARVDNVDPGAVIGRGQGATREEAVRTALESAALTFQLRDASLAMRRSADSLPTNRGAK